MNSLSQDQLSALTGAQQNTPPITGALSKDQLDAMMGSSLTPSQSAMVLGHSNALTNSFLGNLVAGVGQSGLSTVQKVGSAINTGLNETVGKAVDTITGTPHTTTDYSIRPGMTSTEVNQKLEPQNLPQQIGFTGEKVAELLAPGGLEKTAVAKGASYIDKLPDILGLAGKAAGTVTGALKTALQAAVSGLSMGGVTAAQTGDIHKAIGAGELGGVAGVLGGALENFGSGLAQMLNKADFKLSPAAEAKSQKIADNAAQFLTNHGIVGSSATKYDKLNEINTHLESALQESLPNGIAVPKNEIIDSINTSIEQLKQSDPAIYNQAKAKADQAISILNSQEGNIISAKEALNGKRSWASDAFKTAKKSKQDPTVSSEGAFAVEQAYQNALQGAFERSGGEIAVPSQLQKYFGGSESVSLPEFNKVYSDAINAKNLSFMAQFKSDAGLFGRLFGLWAGKSIGQTIMPGLGGEVAGGAAGEILATHLPGMVRNAAERVIQHPGAPETAVKIGQATQNNP